MNEQQIRDWLLKNYLVDTDETRGMLDCIFAHDDTSHLEDRGEQLRAQRCEAPIDAGGHASCRFIPIAFCDYR